MSSFELKTDLIYDVSLGDTKEEKEKEVERLKSMNFISYLQEKPKQTRRDIYSSVPSTMSLGVVLIFVIIIEIYYILVEGRSRIFGFELIVRTYQLYLYTIALTTFFAVASIFLYWSYVALKRPRLTDAEKYVYQIFNALSESGENIEDYIVFQERSSSNSEKGGISRTGYKLKNVKSNWDFQSLCDCFAKIDPVKISLAIPFSIWLAVGSILIFSLIPTPVVESSFLIIIYTTGTFAGVGAIAYFVTGISGVITYRSVRKEFINAQKFLVDKIYFDAEKTPDDLILQLKITNAQAMLNRMEHIPSFPLNPLAKVAIAIPIILTIVTFLLQFIFW